MSTRQTAFSPFENEADVVEVGQLMLENRVDRISVSGDVDLTLDKRGLEQARALQALLGEIVAAMEKRELPDELPPPPAGAKVDNPFM